MSYPGGKGGAGVYQAIINQMPPHDVYIEPFLGFGTILKRKRPAPIATIGIDADADVALARSGDTVDATIIHGDALHWLQQREHWTGRELVYADPPYLRAARRSPSRLYREEYGKLDHVILLAILKRLPCMVLISGYAAPLYLKELAAWRLVTFPAMTRGGPSVEHLWCNFPEPIALHDYSYLGADFRERERIKRKAARWRSKFHALGPLEQKAVLGSLIAANDVPRAAPAAAMPADIAGPGERIHDLVVSPGLAAIAGAGEPAASPAPASPAPIAGPGERAPSPELVSAHRTTIVGTGERRRRAPPAAAMVDGGKSLT